MNNRKKKNLRKKSLRNKNIRKKNLRKKNLRKKNRKKKNRKKKNRIERRGKKNKQIEEIVKKQKENENLEENSAPPNIDDVQREVVVSTDNFLHDKTVEDSNIEEEQKGYTVEHKAVYVNEDEIGQKIYTEETEAEKQERIAVIGTSLEIKNLENEIDEELTCKLKVKDTEERIQRLKEVLILLKSHEMSADTKKEEGDPDDKLNTQNYMKEENRQGESESNEQNVNLEDERKGTDEKKTINTEEEPEIKKTVDSTESKDEMENTQFQQQQESEKEEDKCEEKEDVSQEDRGVDGKDNEEPIVIVKGDLVGGFVNLGTNTYAEDIKKQVRFDLEEEDEKNDTDFGINITVDNVVNHVLLVHEDIEGNSEKHKIDDIYENFPSSQVSGQKFIEDFEKKESEQYKVETEDISDVDENTKSDLLKEKEEENNVNKSGSEKEEEKEEENNEKKGEENIGGESDMKNEKDTEGNVNEEKKEEETVESIEIKKK